MQYYVGLARKALTENKLALCRQYLQRADSAGGSKVTQPVYAELNTAGETLLEAADAKYKDGQYLEAVRAYQDIMLALGNTPVGQRAKKKFEAAEQDPAVRSAVQEVTAAHLMDEVRQFVQEYRQELEEEEAALEEPVEGEAAASQPADAEAACAQSQPASQPDQSAEVCQPDSDVDVIAGMPLDEQGKIVARLRWISASYGQSPTGRQAGEWVKQLEADPELAAALKEWDKQQAAVKLFEKGEMYLRSQLFRQAADTYKEVIDKYPDSEPAKAAAKRLEEFRRGKVGAVGAAK